MSNIDKQALRKKLNRRLNDAFGFQRTSGGKHTTISLSIDECKSVLVALDELEAKDKRIAELSASHGKLREAMAGIHNTITAGGAYTPLAAILNSSKRAYEESAAAAGKGEES